ncbi:hypothetical protein FRC10_009266 [Ceratobasidium sp. 414]|nr:hypothetical protein FRC10_009266 [Ceratobasidium sp. 414]
MVKHVGSKSKNWTLGSGGGYDEIEPGVFLTGLVQQEDRILLDAAGRKLPWSAVSALLPGRTDSRCAKRYQILIKEQGPGQASASAPATKKSRKQWKKQTADATHGENETETPCVAGPGGQAAPSADVAPDSTPVTNEIATPEATTAPKPRRKPKARVRAEEKSSIESVEGDSGHGSVPGGVGAGGRGEVNTLCGEFM